MYGTKYHVTDDQKARYPNVKPWVLRNRLTKTSKGITQTAMRSRHYHEGDALNLSVRGSLDSLAWNWSIRRNQMKRASLTPRGRRKLLRLRQQRRRNER